MARPLRIEFPGALYHITSRGNERKEIFLDDDDRKRFLSILSDYHERHGILVHVYVLMDNHYHLILETPKANLNKVMHGINGGYTTYFNRRHSRVGHLFQGRYRSILVDRDEYLLPLSRYVHLNPVRAGKVRKPEEYPWSSYGAYIGKRRKEDWVEYTLILSEFSSHWKLASKRYEKYVNEWKGENPFDNVFAQLIMGGEQFRKRILSTFRGTDLSPEIPERKRIKVFPTIDEIVNKVSEAFNIDEKEVVSGKKRSNIARNVALYLAHRYSGLGNGEVGRYFGNLQVSAVSKVVERLKKAMDEDRGLAKLVEKLESNVKT